MQSLWRLVRYHLGTVAFGSFLVALVQFIRMIMKFVEKKLKKHGAANKACMVCLKVSLLYCKYFSFFRSVKLLHTYNFMPRYYPYIMLGKCLI